MNNLLFLTPVVVLVLLAAPLTANAVGFLHFKPEKGAHVPANHFLAVNGTSAPSNATRTKCNVQLQTNQKGYVPVTPTGPNGKGDYTTWNATTSEMMKVGINQLEGQIECFPPTGNLSAPNYLHHLVHNVTAS